MTYGSFVVLVCVNVAMQYISEAFHKTNYNSAKRPKKNTFIYCRLHEIDQNKEIKAIASVVQIQRSLKLVKRRSVSVKCIAMRIMLQVWTHCSHLTSVFVSSEW